MNQITETLTKTANPINLTNQRLCYWSD